jgi:hypothetical protein
MFSAALFIIQPDVATRLSWHMYLSGNSGRIYAGGTYLLGATKDNHFVKQTFLLYHVSK